MLDIKQLEKLRKEIVLNSLYTNDYENSLGICPINCQDFFDGFFEEMQMEQEEDEEYGVEKDLSYYDTTDRLSNYYDNFEDDPLPIDKVYQYMYENRIPWDKKHYEQLKEQGVGEE